jgi:hypothetical protein
VNGVLYVVPRKLLDHSFQFGVFLAHDLFELTVFMPQPTPTNIRTNCSTPTYSSKMRTRFTVSMQLEAWNSRADLPTCRGTRVRL